MTKEQLWNEYVRRNPQFLITGAHFTPKGLRKFFETTWDNAAKDKPQCRTIPEGDGIIDFIKGAWGR